MAMNHFDRGRCESWNIVPTVVLNCFAQFFSRHWYSRVRLFFVLVLRLTRETLCDPQVMQRTPIGQRNASRYFKHLSSVLNLRVRSNSFTE